ncbi:MAG: RNA-binding S4 domain-containing protein [Thermoleophilaceae bacterium]|nr:RNA-binding S4 domain-containing protein [Thermoleophilaceae bacterium]
MEVARIDRWLTAVRIFKTRTFAGAACGGGKVRINGVPAKPSAKVKVGDRIEARVGKIERIVVVTRLIEKRVGAAIAAQCYEDHSPVPEPAIRQPPGAVREPGAGRPTKRDRRKIDKFRGR